jgi:hypothetical protein
MNEKDTAKVLRELADKIDPPITNKVENVSGATKQETNALPKKKRKPDWLDKHTKDYQQSLKDRQLSE